MNALDFLDSLPLSRCLAKINAKFNSIKLVYNWFFPLLFNQMFWFFFYFNSILYECPLFISVACVDSFSFSRCLAKARIAAVSLCSLAELDSVTRVKKNEECIMSVVNPGIPRVKVTDPTVLSIKELISRGELNPSNSQGPKRASHPFVRWTAGVWPRPRTLINTTENPLGLCFQQWVIHWVD